MPPTSTATTTGPDPTGSRVHRDLPRTERQRQAENRLHASGLTRASVDVFFGADGSVDDRAIAALLTAIKEATKPVNPAILGVIGDMQWRFLLRREGAARWPAARQHQ